MHRFSGEVDVLGVPILPASMRFTTTRRATDLVAADPEEWVPDALNPDHRWRANRPPSPWETLQPLMAPTGATAIAGRVLTLDGHPCLDAVLNEAARTEATHLDFLDSVLRQEVDAKQRTRVAKELQNACRSEPNLGHRGRRRDSTTRAVLLTLIGEAT